MKAHPFRTTPARNPSKFHRFSGPDDGRDALWRRVDSVGDSTPNDGRGETEILRRNAEFVLIQFCESDETPLSLIGKSAYREWLARHVAMARRIGIEPILVAPVRMRAYTPAGEQRQPASPYIAVMQEVAEEMEGSFVDVQIQRGRLVRFVGKELSKQLLKGSNCFIYYNELGIRRMLSWWFASRGDGGAADA